MGYVSCFSRFFLAFINGLVVITCLLLIGVGAVQVILPGLGIIEFLVDGSAILTKLKDTLTSTGLGTETHYDDLGLSVSAALKDVGIMLAVTGSVILIMSCCGFLGGCCKLKCSLVAYVAISGILLLLEIIGVIILYSDEDLVIRSIKENVLATLDTYEGLTGTNVQSLGWNFVMVKYLCCGLTNYNDFKRANWTRAVTTTSGSYNLKTPIVCCNPLPTTPVLTCATVTSGGNTASTGCFDTVWNSSFGNPTFKAFAFCVGFFIQLIFIILAIIVFVESKKKNRIAAEKEMRQKTKRNQIGVVAEPLPRKQSLF